MADSVPFSILDPHSGHIAAEGIVRLEGDNLILDVNAKNRWYLFGEKSSPKQYPIPLKYVDALQFKNHWFLFHVWLRLRVRSLEFLSTVPGFKGAEMILWCSRRYRTIAQDLANLVTLRLLERKLTDEQDVGTGTQTT